LHVTVQKSSIAIDRFAEGRLCPLLLTADGPAQRRLAAGAARILGHRPLKMLSRFLKVSPSQLREPLSNSLCDSRDAGRFVTAPGGRAVLVTMGTN